MKSTAIAILATMLSLQANAAPAGEPLPEDLASFLADELAGTSCPSIAAAVVDSEQILALGAAGLRALGSDTAVTAQDKYHLGSCTKPMTATLAAILVEEGALSWESKVGDILDTEHFPSIHPQHLETTLQQLLSHTGGLATAPPLAAWAQAWNKQGSAPAEELREEFCKAVLALPPAYPPGSQTMYSNQGYAIAGLMMELATETPWETLLDQRLFTQLGMDSAGFRAPTGDQPRGHRGETPVEPGPSADNPDAIAPAGAVHASIADWAKFARFHLRREPAELIKSPKTFDQLHSLAPNSGKHAICGWLAHDIEAMGGRCMQMVGSNTMWMSLLWILPEKDLAIVVATNTADPDAFPLCDRVAAKLIARYR